MLSRRIFLLGLAAAGFNASSDGLADESYPNRTIKLIVPFPPGTPSEFVIRRIAERLATKFGQPVIIENRPGGAGGTVGAAAAAGAEPDGYTLLASPPGPLVTAPVIYRNLGYDPVRSFVPVALLFNSPQLLTLKPDFPAQSIRELVAFARANPGRISFASPGHGTQPHLLGELLKSTTGLEIVHVPYKGPAAALTDLLGGQVQIYFETAPLILPQVAAGKLRVIAVAAESRIAQMPDVPTTTESGFPELVGGFWSGILAPAGTPVKIVGKLNSAINETMQSPQVQDSPTKLAGHARVGSPDEFAAFIAAERQKWTPIAARVKAD